MNYQGAAASKAADAASTTASACRRPTSCRLMIGRPSAVKPHGMLGAGWPVKLNRYVKKDQPSSSASPARHRRGVLRKSANAAGHRGREQQIVAFETVTHLVPERVARELCLNVGAQTVA